MNRKILVAVILLFLSVCLFGDEERELVVAFGSGDFTYNPMHSYTASEAQLYTAIYEGLVIYEVAGAPHCVAQVQWRHLADVGDLARSKRCPVDLLQFLPFSALGERLLELVMGVEMILDCALTAAGHKEELLDPGGARFVHGVFDQRFVDDREHFLRECLGGGQEPGPETAYREYRFADGLHAVLFLLQFEMRLGWVAGAVYSSTVALATRETWPFALTLYHACSMMPRPSTTTVDLMRPSYSLP